MGERVGEGKGGCERARKKASGALVEFLGGEFSTLARY